MSALFKYIFTLIILFFQVAVFAQNEYEDDLEFETPQKKDKPHFEGKRLVNLHFNLGYNLSTITGTGVTETRDTLDAISRRNGLDSYNIVPSYWPTAAVEVSLNFFENASVVFGVKYNMLGWREVAKLDNGNFYFRFKSKFEMHRISIPLAFHYHPSPNVSLYAGAAVAFAVNNRIIGSEIQIFNQDTLVNYNEILDFEQTTGVAPRVASPQFFFGSHFGFDRFRLNLNFTFTPNFIRDDIAYHNLAAEAGITIKLFKDYDKDF